MTTKDYRITEARIELRGLTFFAYHGVLPEERKKGNTFLVDLALDADISLAASSDDLDDTVNYAAVYDVVKREMDIPSQLLEHVCGRIARALLDNFAPLQRVSLCVVKRNPPIEGAGVCESAVRMTMER